MQISETQSYGYSGGYYKTYELSSIQKGLDACFASGHYLVPVGDKRSIGDVYIDVRGGIQNEGSDATICVRDAFIFRQYPKITDIKSFAAAGYTGWGSEYTKAIDEHLRTSPLHNYYLVPVGQPYENGDFHLREGSISSVLSSSIGSKIKDSQYVVVRKRPTQTLEKDKEKKTVANETINKPGFIGGAIGKAWGSTKKMAPAVMGQQAIDAGINFLAETLGKDNPAVQDFIRSPAVAKPLGVLIPAFAAQAAEQYPTNKIAKAMVGPLNATLDAGAYTANTEVFEKLLLPMFSVMANAMGVNADAVNLMELLSGQETEVKEPMPAMPGVREGEKVGV